MSCKSILARNVNGDSRPIGSNSVAIFFKKFLYEYIMSSLGLFSSNVNSPWSASHQTPNDFVDGKWSLSKSTSDFRSSDGILFSTCGEFDNHFRVYIPALVSSVESSIYSVMPCSSVLLSPWNRPCMWILALFLWPQEMCSGTASQVAAAQTEPGTAMNLLRRRLDQIRRHLGCDFHPFLSTGTYDTVYQIEWFQCVDTSLRCHTQLLFSSLYSVYSPVAGALSMQARKAAFQLW